MLTTLKETDSGALENFLTAVNGEEYQLLAHDYIKAMFSSDFRRPSFIVAHDEANIIGAAAFSEELFTVNTWGISWVSVDPQSRNQGLGQKLVEACLDHIARRIENPATAILLTYPGKTALYEKLGFKGSTYDHEGGVFLSLTILPKTD